MSTQLTLFLQTLAAAFENVISSGFSADDYSWLFAVTELPPLWFIERIEVSRLILNVGRTKVYVPGLDY